MEEGQNLLVLLGQGQKDLLFQPVRLIVYFDPALLSCESCTLFCFHEVQVKKGKLMAQLNFTTPDMLFLYCVK